MWGMNATVGAETGFRTTGVLYTSRSQADDQYQEEWLRRSEPYQLGSHRLTADEVAALLPGSTIRYKAARIIPPKGTRSHKRLMLLLQRHAGWAPPF
jgi:hypothetical protein